MVQHAMVLSRHRLIYDTCAGRAEQQQLGAFGRMKAAVERLETLAQYMGQIKVSLVGPPKWQEPSH